MDFQIRECIMSDINYIYQLNCSEMGYEYPENETKRNLELLLKSNSDKIFVATVQNLVVGYIHANNYNLIYAPHMKNIMGIAVCSSFKRRGIGRALLNAVEEWAKETNACGVRLVSGATRTEAHEFYRHCGYGGDKKQVNFKKLFE